MALDHPSPAEQADLEPICSLGVLLATRTPKRLHGTITNQYEVGVECCRCLDHRYGYGETDGIALAEALSAFPKVGCATCVMLREKVEQLNVYR